MKEWNRRTGKLSLYHNGNALEGIDVQFPSTIEGDYIVVELKTCEGCGRMFTRKAHTPIAQCPKCVCRERQQQVVRQAVASPDHRDLLLRAMEALGGNITTGSGTSSALPRYIRPKDVAERKRQTKRARGEHGKNGARLPVHGPKAS